MSQRDRWGYIILVTLASVATVSFTVWWFFDNHIPSNFVGVSHILDYLLFVFLSYVVFHDIINQTLSWFIAWKISPLTIPRPEDGLKVAFITTFVPKSEPLELLHNILPAMVNVEYPHDSWLLDEGDSNEAKKLCAKYGVKYFTRKNIEKYSQPSGKFAVKTKGGNHNAWYDYEGYKYDIVAQIDTDFIPRQDFLVKTLGFFKNPKIAFVGTPQIYGNTNRSFVAKGAAQQSYTFYGPILRGLAGRKMTFLIGANHVVRVKALKDIGFYNAHLTEDLLTGLELHSRRWESVYVPEALAIGEGPTTWTSYFNQQMRWAFGCIDILFKHTPRLIRKMKHENALIYFLMQQHYFTGLAMILGLILLTLYAFFGITPTSMNLFDMLAFYLPVVIAQYVIFFWLQKFYIDPKTERGLLIAGRIVSIAVWVVYFLALVGVLRKKRLVFKVTPKGENLVKSTPLSVFKPQLIIALLMTINVAASLLMGNTAIVMIFWMVFTGVFMFCLVLPSIYATFVENVSRFADLRFFKSREQLNVSG